MSGSEGLKKHVPSEENFGMRSHYKQAGVL